MGHHMLIELETGLLTAARLIVGIFIIVRREVLRDRPPIYRAAAAASSIGFLFCAFHISANHSGVDQGYVIGVGLAMGALGVQALQRTLPRERAP